MDLNEEYHDPDYAGTAVQVPEESKKDPEVDKAQKIRNIVRREFDKELQERENEVDLIHQRMSSARRLLHRLRYSLVSRYYQAGKLQLNGDQIHDEITAQQEPWAKAQVSSILREGQRRIHPSVRKLLGQQQTDLDEIFRYTGPRSNTRKDYSAMVQARNYTISADKTKSLRPQTCVPPPPEPKPEPGCSRPKKIPRQIDPKVENVVTLDDATRNRQKHRFRIIIGNTSKYAAPASRLDRSTHKWLLYVRGVTGATGATGVTGVTGVTGSLSDVVTAVTVTLHHSYAPHHIVHIDKPPYQVSRRGWGEFPARVELHFALPRRNRPAAVEHTIKLDRNYTGLQTLGAETVVDVWLYSDEKMLKHEFKELPQPPIEVKQEKPEEVEVPIENQEPIEETDPNKQLDSWFEFFNKENQELDVDEMIIKAVKKNPEVPVIEDMDTVETVKEIVKQEVLEPEEIHQHNVTEDENVFDSGVDTRSEIEAETRNLSSTDNLTMETPDNLLGNMPTELLTQATSIKKRIMKYMDPTTGRIYYLEMDRNLDLTKVQEIVINSKGNIKTAKISPIKPDGLKNVRRTTKKGVSLLKPEVTNRLKAEPLAQTVVKTEKVKKVNNFKHIGNDHCYLGAAWTNTVKFHAEERTGKKEYMSQNTLKNENKVTCNKVEMEVERELCLYDRLCTVVKRFSCERLAVNYLLSKIPLICKDKDGEFMRNFPFVVESEDVYWKLDFAKRRNIEWSRAKTINKILAKHSNLKPTWRTKQILLFSRLHGYHPIREEKLTSVTTTDENDQWSSWNDLENTRKIESTIKEIFSNPSDINSLTIFKPENYLTDIPLESIDLTEAEEDVDVVGNSPVKVKTEVLPDASRNLTVLPVEGEEDRLRFLFVERMCQDIGVELRNEDVGNGFSYSAVHAVLLTAMKRFAEELIRESLATSRASERTSNDCPLPVWTSTDDTFRPSITLRHLWGALRHGGGRATVSGAGRGALAYKHYAL